MDCYKDILPDMNNGKFWKHLQDVAPESSTYIGIMVAVPYLKEPAEEFENPTPIDGDYRHWKLSVVQNCRIGPRKRSMTELLFCMLRSGK